MEEPIRPSIPHLERLWCHVDAANMSGDVAVAPNHLLVDWYTMVLLADCVSRSAAFLDSKVEQELL